MPSPLELSVRRIPAIDVVGKRARYRASLLDQPYVFAAVDWTGATPNCLDGAARIDPKTIYVSPIHATAAAREMAIVDAEETRQSVGYGYARFARSGELADVRCADFKEPDHPAPVRPWPVTTPTGRCPECNDYGVIAVYGDGGEDHGDRVTSPKDLKNWAGPWACSACGAPRALYR